MPSLRHIPLEGAALKEFFDQQQAENYHGNNNDYSSNCQTLHHDEGANDNSKQIQGPTLDCVVSSCNVEPSSSASNNHAADCFAGNIEEHVCAYPGDESKYNNAEREQQEDGYLSDTILDKVLNCDRTHTSKPENQSQTMPYEEENEVKVNSSHRIGQRTGVFENTWWCNHDTRFKYHHAHTLHQQEEENQDRSGTTMSKRFKYHHNYMHNQREDENQERGGTARTMFENTWWCNHDTRLNYNHANPYIPVYHQQWEEKQQERRFFDPTVPPAQYGMIQFTNAPFIGNTGSSYGGKNGQDSTPLCNASFFSKDKALCTSTITNDTKRSAVLTEGTRTGTTKGCEPKQKRSAGKPSPFEKHFNELKAFKEKHGHCDVKIKSGDDEALGRWCWQLRQSLKKNMNDEAPNNVFLLSEDKIKRLDGIGFDWKFDSYFLFERRLMELKAFKAKYGHCNVKTKSGEDKDLGRWCSRVRQSLKRVKNNKVPIVARLTKENIRRLESIGFDCWANTYSSFEDRLEELRAFKEKYGHCNPNPKLGNYKPLGRWCSKARHSIKKIKNDEEPLLVGLSEDNIQRLKDIGFVC